VITVAVIDCHLLTPAASFTLKMVSMPCSYKYIHMRMPAVSWSHSALLLYSICDVNLSCGHLGDLYAMRYGLITHHKMAAVDLHPGHDVSGMHAEVSRFLCRPAPGCADADLHVRVWCTRLTIASWYPPAPRGTCNTAGAES